MKKKRIITDTNIWYSIKNEEVSEISENYQLVIPIILLNELYTSPNVYLSEISFGILKKAINTVLQNLNYIEFLSTRQKAKQIVFQRLESC